MSNTTLLDLVKNPTNRNTTTLSDLVRDHTNLTPFPYTTGVRYIMRGDVVLHDSNLHVGVSKSKAVPLNAAVAEIDLHDDVMFIGAVPEQYLSKVLGGLDFDIYYHKNSKTNIYVRNATTDETDLWHLFCNGKHTDSLTSQEMLDLVIPGLVLPLTEETAVEDTKPALPLAEFEKLTFMDSEFDEWSYDRDCGWSYFDGRQKYIVEEDDVHTIAEGYVRNSDEKWPCSDGNAYTVDEINAMCKDALLNA